MEVRLATRSDIPALGRALGQAFADDPVASHMIPAGSADRERRLAWLMGIPTKTALRHHHVYTTAERVAAAV